MFDFKDTGAEVRVTYLRPLRTHPSFGAVNPFYTRHQLNLLGLTGRSYNPRGGETRVEIRLPSGRRYYGVALCSPKDNFCRETGRTLALARAMTSAYNDLFRRFHENVPTFAVDSDGVCEHHHTLRLPWTPMGAQVGTEKVLETVERLERTFRGR